MTDPYVWFDPHDARNRAEIAEVRLRGVHFQIQNARQNGQEDILQKIVEGEKSKFWAAMMDSLAYMAERVADEVVFPAIRANYAEAKTRQRIVANELRALSLQVLLPMRTAPSPIGIQAYMAPANGEGEQGARIVFTMPAFSYTQQLPPLKDF